MGQIDGRKRRLGNPIKYLRLYSLVLELASLNPGLKQGIFERMSWLNGSFFGGDDWGFIKEEVKTYLNGTNVVT